LYLQKQKYSVNYRNISTSCERLDDDMIGWSPTKMYIYFVEYRVFVPFNKTERAKHKSTSCAPYEREKRASSKIITFCPVNLDKNNLRKQTSVHLLWGQTTLIVEGKRSTKIDFNKFARRLLGEKNKDFYNIKTLNTRSRENHKIFTRKII